MSTEKPSVKILKAIENLKSDYLLLNDQKLNEEEIRNRNEFIMDNYPTLASKIKENTLDMEIIGKMLLSLDKMHSGQQSEHDASVDVGTLLRDKIVIPDMKRQGKDVTINNDISNLNPDEAKKKVNEIFQL